MTRRDIESMMNTPNLFIVGAAKAGTTSLYSYLLAHPEVFLSAKKETNYFSWQDILDQNLYYQTENITTAESYQSLFSPVAGQKIIGEVSPSYLFYPKVAERLYKFNPDAKIIILLRDPVARAVSHYSMDKRLGYVNLQLEDIIHDKNQSHKMKLHYQQYIDLGMYTNQVRRYLDIFPQGQIRIFEFDQLKKHPKIMMNQISDFLDIDSQYEYPIEVVHNPNISPRFNFVKLLFQQPKLRNLVKATINPRWLNYVKQILFKHKSKQSISPDLELALWNLFKDDVKELQSVLKLDLSHWKKK